MTFLTYVILSYILYFIGGVVYGVFLRARGERIEIDDFMIGFILSPVTVILVPVFVLALNFFSWCEKMKIPVKECIFDHFGTKVTALIDIIHSNITKEPKQ